LARHKKSSYNTLLRKLILNSLILGLNIFGHDSSAVLISAKTGKIHYCLTEERFSNVKHDGSFPMAAVTEIKNKIRENKLGNIKYIGLNVNPAASWIQLKDDLKKILGDESGEEISLILEKYLSATTIYHPNFFPVNYILDRLKNKNFSGADIELAIGRISWFGNFYIRHNQLKKNIELFFPGADVYQIDHHLCHASCAYFLSQFQEAAILTIDGQGEAATLLLAYGKENEINIISQSIWPNSLGALYMQLANYLGFDGDDWRYPGFGDEYKVMGMSAYGEPQYIDEFRRIGFVNEQGQFQILFGDLVELSPVIGCPGHSQPVFSDEFFGILGPKRNRSDPLIQRHFDIAKSGQLFLEEIGVSLAKFLKTRCNDAENLCIAGGVGLNGLMNMKIYKDAGFKNIFIPPAPGDDGTALGAALYVSTKILGGGRNHNLLPNAFLGLDYSEDDIESSICKFGLRCSKPYDLYSEVAELLSKGNIVARFNGRSEFGPRALGNRSILANPTISSMKDTVNLKVKHRESFRPFAPACLEEKAAEYFELDTASPFMLLICKGGNGTKDLLPAVIHNDGTARLQTVNPNQSEDFYNLLKSFERYTGVPILLNTSFNVNGEAIVETPIDAINSFLFMNIDYLAIGPFLISRNENKNIQGPETLQELLEIRKTNYSERYLSEDKFFWEAKNPIETDLALTDVYRVAAEERLMLINQLSEELHRNKNEN